MEIFLQTYFKFFKLPLFLIFTFLTSSSSSSIDPLSQALLTLKSNLTDPSNTLGNWISPSEQQNPPSKISACSWVGVKCNENSTKITSLDLSMKNLGGEFKLSPFEFSLFTDLLVLNISHNSFSQKLPIGIFNLTNLRVLDISRNNFSGNFPSGISSLEQLTVLDAFSNSFSGELPADVSELRSLQVLNFAGSYFSGPIPSNYGSLSSLEFIHLAGNFLNGKIPQELGKLKSLNHMEIGYNSYEGTIPWQFGNMSELQYLDIAGANISGSIPIELSNLTNLHTLFLFRNQINGLIPVEFSKIKNLANLDLSDNLLTGPIPESFSELSNLRLLSLMYNNMNGSVPQGIANLPLLDALLIWDNFFTGSLPENLGMNSNLKWVDVSTNNFVGLIPPNICSNGFLSKLILFSNQFSGGLEPSLSNCSSLVRLRVEDNLFSGPISLNFNDLSDISYIDLSRNNFDGGIPNEIFRLSNLEYFNVSNNSNLGGLIPPRTWSLPVLQNFSASHCNITGEIPPFHSCKSLSVLELNGNRLSGNFPENVSHCHFLEKMNLASNNLTGHIPEEIASLSLSLLNVSFNDLSGSIPTNKSILSMGSSSFEGNPRLCGAPLKSCHQGKEIASGLELRSRRTQKLAWVLILCGVVVLFITISVFGVFHFMNKKGEWEMVSFVGIPQLNVSDVMRSFNSVESMESMSVFKAVLPTGVTVLVRKIEWNSKKTGVMVEFIRRMGHVRHKNLNRLLGFCYNKDSAYLFCDYLPNGNLAEKIGVKRDWAAKYKIVVGIAKGLCFLHHDCYPSIPHGDLKASNVVFDENMEPHLAGFGFKSLVQLNNCSFAPTISMMETGELNNAIKDELHADVYNFGEIILEILTNGRMKNGGVTVQNKPNEILVKDIYNENEASSSKSVDEEIKRVFEVCLLCTRNRPSDRPSMDDAMKLLLGLKPGQK